MLIDLNIDFTSDGARSLTGTMAQWSAAVCTSPQFTRGEMMPSAVSGGQCEAGDSTYQAPVVFGVYPRGSQSAIDGDIAKFGPYAEGEDGTHEMSSRRSWATTTAY